MKTSTEQFAATCPQCGTRYTIDLQTYNLFGHDCHCMKCTDNAHIEFMRTTGRKLKLSCVKGCRCGAGQ